MVWHTWIIKKAAHEQQNAFWRRLSVRCFLLLRLLIDCLFSATMELYHIIRSASESAFEARSFRW